MTRPQRGGDYTQPYSDPLSGREARAVGAAISPPWPVDASAERQPGFVWRLRGAGAPASGADAFDDAHIAATLSVWTDRDALVAFVYRDEGHRGIMARRREWFDRMEGHLVLWWVPAGHRPDLAEGRDQLALLRRDGPTPEAFTVARGFPAPA